MPYFIDATDKPGTKDLRDKTRPEHLVFLDKHIEKLIAVGPKLSDDGQTSLGSTYIIDVDERKAAEDFIHADPFYKAGLFGNVSIARWRKGFFDGKKVPPPK
jgi:uncharacterized protein YciI